MANLNEIAVFDIGWAPKIGTMYKINKNDAIESFTMSFAHLPKSSIVDYGYKVSTNTARSQLRGGIWIVKDGWSLANEPDYKSKNIVDTNAFDVQNNKNNFNFTQATFDFDESVRIYADKIVLGVYSETEDDAKSNSLCYKKVSGTTLYYMRDILAWRPEYQLNNTNGIAFDNVSIRPYIKGDDTETDPSKPTIGITNINSRTLSLAKNHVENFDLPSADADKKVIKIKNASQASSSSNPQWNTTSNSHDYENNGGYDFAEGCLQDVLIYSSTAVEPNNPILTPINVSEYNSPSKPYWTHARSRILIKFAPWKNGASRLYYTVHGPEGNVKSVEFPETAGSANTLLICPRDEGISDNCAWSIEFRRVSIDNKGRKGKESDPLVLNFNTFVDPKVNITYPKPIRNKKKDESGNWYWEDQTYNYVLWANDVINNPKSESRDSGAQICNALNVLLSKDGGDNSKFPIFTRIHIKEIEGNYTQTKSEEGEFPNFSFDTPTNEAIINNSTNVNVLAYWTGVQLDDGNLIQLSGINDGGFDWDWVIEESMPEYSKPLYIDFNEDEEKRPKPLPYHSIYVELEEDENGNPLESKKPCYTIDKRMCFRAGRKYLVSVRRFHSVVAGALAANQYTLFKRHWNGGKYYYPQSGNYTAAPIKDENYPGYYRIATSSDQEFPYYKVEINNGNVKDNTAVNKWMYDNNRGVYQQLTFDSEGNPYGTFGLRWLGPADGSSGVKLSDTTNINKVYPGYSPVDYVILDCLNSTYTARDVVTIRPGIQELNANSWITFAYRHLSKNMGGSDKNDVTNAAQTYSAESNLSGNYKDDGTPEPNDSKEQVGKTWGGNDNTATRIIKMYRYLVAYYIKKINSLDDNWPGSYNKIDDNQLNSLVNKKYPGYRWNDQQPKDTLLKSSKLTIRLLKDDYNNNPNYDNITLYHDANFNGELKEACYADIVNLDKVNFEDADTWNKIQVIMNYAPESINCISCDQNRVPHQCETCISSKNKDKRLVIGNTYNWIPIINATDNSGNTNLPIKCKVPINYMNYSRNNYKMYDNELNPSTYYNIDTTHGIKDVNSHQPIMSFISPTLEGYEEGKTSFRIREYPGSRLDRGSPGNGSLYTTVADTRYQQVAAPEDYAINKNSAGIQYFNKDTITNRSLQRTTGELYLRVPLSQDCENGIPTENRYPIPQCPVKWPLVRTTHMLYYKTYTFGHIVYDYELNLDVWVVDRHDYADGSRTIEISETGCDPLKVLDNDNKTYVDYNLGIGWAAVKVPDPQNEGNFIDRTLWGPLQVYGEDNGGMGRLLSADNDTSVWYNGNKEPRGVNSIKKNENDVTLDGGIEIPLRVRYTPLVQPIMTTDTEIVGDFSNSDLINPNTNNVITVTTCRKNCTSETYITIEWNSDSFPDHLRYEKGFNIYLSYGMGLSVMGGRYVSTPVVDNEISQDNYLRLVQSTNYLKVPKFNNTDKPLPGKRNAHKVTSGDRSATAWQSTDIYPAVGICNCFLVLLVPTDSVKDNVTIDYAKQVSNWFHDRSNYEDITSKTNKTAKPVIVADLAFSENESVKNTEKTIDQLYKLTNEQWDHQLRTLYKCNFNYYNLLHTKTLNSESKCKTKIRKNSLKTNIWYDLVVVPVYSNYANGAKIYNYEDGAGTINDKAYGGGTADADTNVDYYGSNPLVIKKYLKITDDNRVSTTRGYKVINGKKIPQENTCVNTDVGGEDGEIIPTPTPQVDPDIYPWTQPAIIYPNVNNNRFGYQGYIPECPGFWLNNSFRVIMRGPHFRSDEDIRNHPSSYAFETSIETISNGQLTGEEGTKKYKFSDVQVHLGKYRDIVLNGDGTVMDKRSFYDPTFQEELNQNSNNVQWLNARNIFSMQYNRDAFSKCTPQAKLEGDSRDIVLGGDLGYDTTNTETYIGSNYKDRFFEFWPSAVNAKSPYKEGFYIQFRYLNTEYGDTSSGNSWSPWYGGLLADGMLDTALSYCVPIRNYNDVYTSYRRFIKESYPGSALNIIDESGRYYIDVGKGTESPKNEEGEDPKETYIPYGNNDKMPIVPSSSVPIVDQNGHKSENNTDFPYGPQIWCELSAEGNKIFNSNPDESKKRFPIPEDIDKNHRRYWEMYYVDYIVRNMVKLYYSEFEGAHMNNSNAPKPKHFGWTKTLQNEFPDTNWTPGKVNTGYVSHSSQSKNVQSIENKDPSNKNRYFRKPIMKEDFDDLVDALQTLVAFIRDEQFTGTHCSENDLKDATGKSTGSGVVMIDPDLIDFNRDIRGIIGHDNNYHASEDKFNIPIDTNYLRILFDTIVTKVIKQM